MEDISEQQMKENRITHVICSDSMLRKYLEIFINMGIILIKPNYLLDVISCEFVNYLDYLY
jgi:hypothetical protein